MVTIEHLVWLNKVTTSCYHLQHNIISKEGRCILPCQFDWPCYQLPWKCHSQQCKILHVIKWMSDCHDLWLLLCDWLLEKTAFLVHTSWWCMPHTRFGQWLLDPCMFDVMQFIAWSTFQHQNYIIESWIQKVASRRNDANFCKSLTNIFHDGGPSE